MIMLRDIHKNPVFYYAVIPILIALWPLSIWLHYLPQARQKLTAGRDAYVEARSLMSSILTLDPTRLELAQAKITEETFDYPTAVEKVATKCGILQTNYSVTVKPPRTSGGNQKSQNASVKLEKVDFAAFAKFLSSLQLTWTNLQCEEINLNKVKGGAPDQWDVDLNFKYYY